MNKKLIKILIASLLLIIASILVYYMFFKNNNKSENKIILNTKSITLEVGQTKVIDISIGDINSNDIVWESEDANIAIVDSNGNVTGVKEGKTYIVIKYGNKFNEKCKVTVNKKEEPKTEVKDEKLIINKTSTTINVDKSEKLYATIGKKQIDKDVEWTSSNTEVAVVDNNGNVKGIKEGTATITVKTKDGNKKATCEVTVVNPTVKVTGVSLNKTSVKIKVNESIALVATVLPSNATNNSVTWSSSDTSIATVNSSGVVTGKKAGTATITVKTNDGDKKASAKVTVEKSTVKVTGVSLNKTSAKIKVKETMTLVATVSPSNATNKSVTWTSSNASVATVNSSGVVTGKKAGTTTITVKTKDGNKKASIKVTVEKTTVKVTGVSLNKTNVELKPNEKENLVATISPSNATNKSVTWSSSNTSVATVNSNGVVTGKKAGTATITVKTKDGNKRASVKVTVVKSRVKVTGVSLNKTSTEIKVNETETLVATISPIIATNKSVTWSSSNTSVATVNSSGVVTGKKEGTATITVKTDDGNKTASVKVTVVTPTVSVTGVSLNKTSTKIKINETETLVATVSPSNATNKSVTWSSSDASIATVNSSGVVTGKKAGTATITVKTKDGNKKASITVTVISAKIHFFNTGNSDAILLESNGKYGMVDSGLANDKVKNYLTSMGVTHLDFIIATHNHGDHIGGMEYLGGFVDSTTKYYYRSTSNDEDSPFQTAINTMTSKGVSMVEVTGKYPEFSLGEFKILLMNTEDASADEKKANGKVIDSNKNSIVAYVTYNGANGTLLTGDMESQDEYRMISQLANKPVDVLKVAHHSWQSSTTMKFTKAIKPKVAVVTGYYILDDISTSVYYMQQKYGTKFYLTSKSDTAVTIDYTNGLSVSPSKAFVANYQVKETVSNWRKLQNGIWFYVDSGNDLDTIVYDDWRYYNNQWYYLGIQGNMMTGFVESKYKGQVNTYYLDKNGAMLTGWQQPTEYGPYNNDKDHYYKSWIYSHFNVLVLGWYQYDGTRANGKNWFYFEPGTGIMYHDVCKTIDGKYYCFNHDGVCTTGC